MWHVTECRAVQLCGMHRVGQHHIYTLYIRCFWQGNHHIYGHVRCVYTVLANPRHVAECRAVQLCGMHHIIASTVFILSIRQHQRCVSWARQILGKLTACVCVCAYVCVYVCVLV